MGHAIIFSDAHVHPHKRSVERLEDCLRVVDWVFETAKGRGVEDIVFGGDLLHDRQKIDVFTYMRLWETLRRHLTGGLRLWLLLGNHDLWYAQKHSISSVKPLSSLPGVQVIDRPSRIKIAGDNFDFIPYTHDPIATLKELRGMPGEARYAVGHIALHGAKLNSSGTAADVVIEHDGDMVVVDPGIFEGYDQVFLGHYHCEQKLADNVEYVGSPLELSFGEAFQRKHIIDFDAGRNRKEYIENTFSPKHLYLKPDQLDKYDLKKNFVCVLTDDLSAADVVTMREELVKNREVGTLQIRQGKKRQDEDTVIQDAKAILFNEGEMLDRYMKEVPPPPGLDGVVCREVGEKITKTKLDIEL